MERSRSGPKLGEKRFMKRQHANIQTSPRSQLGTKSVREEREVDHSHTRTGRERVGREKREIKIYVDLGWVRRGREWIYFKVNVWQFRWNTVFLFPTEDENGRERMKG